MAAALGVASYDYFFVPPYYTFSVADHRYVLMLLAKNAGRVLTHQHILKEVWGAAYAHQSHYVRVHIAELRKKIEQDPARPKLARHGARRRLSPARAGLKANRR